MLNLLPKFPKFSIMLLIFCPITSAFAVDSDVEEILAKNFVFDSNQKKFFSTTVYNQNRTCMIEFAYSSHTGDYLLSLHRFGKIGVGIDLNHLELRGRTLVYAETETNGDTWTGSEIFLDEYGLIVGFKNSGSQYCNFQKKFPVEIE